jgi:hypothetical protein
LSAVYSAATCDIGTTDTKMRPLALARNSTRPSAQREQRVVLGQADIGARMPLGAALARDDVAGDHALAAENLQAEALTIGVAPVAG